MKNKLYSVTSEVFKFCVSRDMIFWYVLFIAILLAQMFYFYLQFQYSEALHIDTYLRSYQAVKVYQKGIITTIIDMIAGKLPPFWVAWLPLPFFLQALGLYVFPDPLQVAKLFSFVSSLSLFIVYTSLCTKILSSRINTWLALVFFATSYMIGFWSTQGITEPFFTVLLLGGTYFLLESKGKYSYVLSSVFINLASFTRYESWSLIPAFIVYAVITNRKRKTGTILYSLSLFLAPLLWMWLNFRMTGDLLFFYHEVLRDSGIDRGLTGDWHVVPILINHILSLVPFGLVILLSSLLIFSWGKRMKLLFVLVNFCVLYLGLIVKIYGGNIGFMPLYLYPSVVLIFPLIAEILGSLIKKKKMLLSVIGIYILLYIYSQTYYPFSRFYPIAPKVKEAGSLLATYNGRVFLFDKDIEEEPLVIASKINQYCLHDCIDFAIHPQEAEQALLQGKNIVYVLPTNKYPDGKIGNYGLRRVFSDSNYSIYIN